MIDMREIEPGCAIDEFHFEMWAGFLRFVLEREETRAAFEAETGTRPLAIPRSGIEAMVDEACGIDREAEGQDYIKKFAVWATPLFWGGPEDISPAISKKLAE